MLKENITSKQEVMGRVGVEFRDPVTEKLLERYDSKNKVFKNVFFNYESLRSLIEAQAFNSTSSSRVISLLLTDYAKEIPNELEAFTRGNLLGYAAFGDVTPSALYKGIYLPGSADLGSPTEYGYKMKLPFYFDENQALGDIKTISLSTEYSVVDMGYATRRDTMPSVGDTIGTGSTQYAYTAQGYSLCWRYKRYLSMVKHSTGEVKLLTISSSSGNPVGFSLNSDKVFFQSSSNIVVYKSMKSIWDGENSIDTFGYSPLSGGTLLVEKDGVFYFAGGENGSTSANLSNPAFWSFSPGDASLTKVKDVPFNAYHKALGKATTSSMDNMSVTKIRDGLIIGFPDTQNTTAVKDNSKITAVYEDTTAGVDFTWGGTAGCAIAASYSNSPAIVPGLNEPGLFAVNYPYEKANGTYAGHSYALPRPVPQAVTQCLFPDGLNRPDNSTMTINYNLEVAYG